MPLSDEFALSELCQRRNVTHVPKHCGASGSLPGAAQSLFIGPYVRGIFVQWRQTVLQARGGWVPTCAAGCPAVRPGVCPDRAVVWGERPGSQPLALMVASPALTCASLGTRPSCWRTTGDSSRC